MLVRLKSDFATGFPWNEKFGKLLLCKFFLLFLAGSKFIWNNANLYSKKKKPLLKRISLTKNKGIYVHYWWALTGPLSWVQAKFLFKLAPVKFCTPQKCLSRDNPLPIFNNQRRTHIWLSPSLWQALWRESMPLEPVLTMWPHYKVLPKVNITWLQWLNGKTT